MSFFQGICLLGYCMFPIDVVAIFLRIFKISKVIKLILISIAIMWSSLGSIGFIASIFNNKDKKFLGIFPVFLFYNFIGWFVITL